ncbi:MAG TPA: hypothetical protein GXX18_00685 [Bacillales bacterium]|nr:hypothetical protein [Bacillales bacterium]
MNIKEIVGLPFVEATVTFRGQSMKLENVLIDTGSAGTIFNVNKLEEIGVKPEADDITQTIQGVGGLEFVYTKKINQISITQDIKINNFRIELGSMDYGLEIDGIIGYDFMKEVGIVIDLKDLYLSIKR